MMENLDSSLQNVDKQDARRVCTLSKLCEVNARQVYIWVSCMVVLCSVIHLHVIAYMCVCAYMCACVQEESKKLIVNFFFHNTEFLAEKPPKSPSFCKMGTAFPNASSVSKTPK